MAANNFTPIQLYRTSTASATPSASNLADGELAINLTDETLYFKNASGDVKLLASNEGAEGSFVNVDVGDGSASAPSFSFTSDTDTGIFRAASNQLGLSTGGTERVRIDASGNVGIGTSSPDAKLHVNGDAEVSQSLGISAPPPSNYWGSGANSGLFTGYGSVGSQGGFDFDITANGYRNSSGTWTSLGINGSTSAAQIRLRTSEGSISFNTDSSRTTGSGTNVSERMRIDSSGNVGIGTSSPSFQLQLSSNSAAKPTSGLWTIVSDARLKKETGEYKKGLEAVCALRPVTYEYNGLGGFAADGSENVSIIAQEAKKHFPECVSTFRAKLNEDDQEETELYNWDGHALTFALVNAVKELKAENDELHTRLAKLEGR